MKKVVLSSAIALVTVFVMSSCNKNKCHECHYDKAGAEIEMLLNGGESLYLSKPDNITVTNDGATIVDKMEVSIFKIGLTSYC
jgi:hypothetical protein